MEVRPLFFDTYLDTIKNSVGTRMFQTIWAEVDGVKKDVTERGELSCAAFASSILYFFHLIMDRHATTASTVKDMEESGWEEITEPKIGCVLVWENKVFDGESVPHIGFYIGEKKALSNSRTERTPQEHHWTYGEKNGRPTRNVVGMYWNKKLENKYWEKTKQP